MDEFEKLLSTYQNRQFLLIHPPGGYGDELIQMGLEKILKKLSINYRVKKLKAKYYWKNFMQYIKSFCKGISSKGEYGNYPADIILFRGGAFLNDIWKDYHFMTKILTNVGKNQTIILAPHSYYFTSTQFLKFFEHIKCETHIFCREMYSYNLLFSMEFPKNVQIHLSHDTALYLSRRDFCPNDQILPEDHILIAPREDRESVVVWDLKKLHGQKRVLCVDPIKLRNFNSFIDAVKNASEVYTDRLHVSILGAILNKKTYLYPNCYPKNKGVYEFSLRRFPNVIFIDSYEFLGAES